MKKGKEEIGKSREQELLFLDKFGKVKKRITNVYREDVDYSKNKKYLCTVVKDGSELKTTIFDAEGNKLWDYEYSSSGGFRVSPNGDYVIEKPGEPEVWDKIVIYYRNGEFKKINTPTGDWWFEDISENGEYFCVVSGGYVILFDKYGKEIWKRDEGFGVEYPYFLGNKFIGAATTGRVGDEKITYFYLYDLSGNLLWKNKIFVSVEEVCFLKEEGNLYVLSGWGHLFLFDVKTGNLLAKYSDEHAPNFNPADRGIQNPVPGWRGIIFNLDFSRIIISSCPENRNIERIETFDKNLKKIGQKEYSIKRDQHGVFVEGYIKRDFKASPIVRFSNDNLISIMTKGGIEVYEVK